MREWRGGPFACDVGAGVCSTYLFFSFEGAGFGARLCKERAGEFDERGGKGAIVTGNETRKSLLYGPVHGEVLRLYFLVKLFIQEA